jgi:hypothetical protein
MYIYVCKLSMHYNIKGTKEEKVGEWRWVSPGTVVVKVLYLVERLRPCQVVVAVAVLAVAAIVVVLDK